MKYYFNLLIHCFNVCIELKPYFQDTAHPLKPIRFFYGEFRRMLYNKKYEDASYKKHGYKTNWSHKTDAVIETVKSWENPNI
jgi:hypothetical protein